MLFFFTLQYFIFLYYFLFPPTHYILIFFNHLLNSESGGALFLGWEEIMHYTGLVSQSFTKKPFLKKKEKKKSFVFF